MLDFDNREIFEEDMNTTKKLLKIEISKAISNQKLLIDSSDKMHFKMYSKPISLPNNNLTLNYKCNGFFYISLIDKFFKLKESDSNSMPFHIKNMSNEFIFDFLEDLEYKNFLMWAEGFLYESFDFIKKDEIDIRKEEEIRNIIFSFPSTRILIKVKDFEKIHKKFILFLYKLVELVHRIKLEYDFNEINVDIRFPIKFMKLQNDNNIQPFQEFDLRIYGDKYSMAKLNDSLMRNILANIRHNLYGIKKETRHKYFSKENLYEVLEENNIILDKS